jgi:hypothetical protein
MTAEKNYGRALAIAVRQGAKKFELRAATGLARLWRDQGKRTPTLKSAQLSRAPARAAG